MKTKLLAGRIGGLPVRASYHEIGDGEISEAVSAVAKTAKGLFKVAAGVGLGLCFLSLLTGGKSTDTTPIEPASSDDDDELDKRPIRQRRTPSPEKVFKRVLSKTFTIDELVLVKTNNQMFTGFCADELFSFSCDGGQRSIPVSLIKMIERKKVDKGFYSFYQNLVILFDGSIYAIDDYGNDCAPVLNFWSVSGKNPVRLGNDLEFVRGAQQKYRADFSSDLKRFILQKKDKLATIIGSQGLEQMLVACNVPSLTVE